MLFNLLGNAIKFTECGGIDMEARIENSSNGRLLLLSVIDTGIGIAEDRLAAIFTPFRQGEGTIARAYGGTGLGLAISSQLVGMMGGDISVQSRLGVGTQFTIRLPLHAVATLPAPVSPPSGARREQSGNALRGARVLIAEDHGINQELILAMTETLGLDAHLVDNGEDAIAAIIAAANAGAPFAAALMDVQMPHMDGLEATRRLRALGFGADRLPVIALTANCYAEDVAACTEAGMQSHLGKPVTTLALARELARWLGPEHAAPAEIPEAMATKPSAALEDRYRSRKSQLVSQLRQSLARAPGQTDWEELTRQLHRLAGVAATFGEPELGEVSRRLEHQLAL